MTEQTIRTERHKVSGEGLVAKIKQLVHQGNIRRIIIKNDQDQTLIEIPLTLGVVGAVLLPVWVAIGAIAALAANYTLEVEKVEESAVKPPVEPELDLVGAAEPKHDLDPQC